MIPHVAKETCSGVPDIRNHLQLVPGKFFSWAYLHCIYCWADQQHNYKKWLQKSVPKCLQWLLLSGEVCGFCFWFFFSGVDRVSVPEWDLSTCTQRMSVDQSKICLLNFGDPSEATSAPTKINENLILPCSAWDVSQDAPRLFSFHPFNEEGRGTKNKIRKMRRRLHLKVSYQWYICSLSACLSDDCTQRIFEQCSQRSMCMHTGATFHQVGE